MNRLAIVAFILFVAFAYLQKQKPSAVPVAIEKTKSDLPGEFFKGSNSNKRSPELLQVSFPPAQAHKLPSVFTFSLTGEDRKIAFSELLFFLDKSWKHDRSYVLDDYDCKHFAHQLYQDAVKQGLAVRFVGMTIKNSTMGHAFNAFNTSDKGIVFVDFTPSKDVNGKQFVQKNIVYAHSGAPYVRIPLNKLGINFSNRPKDFLEKIESGQQFGALINNFNNSQIELAQKIKKHQLARAEIEQMPDSPNNRHIAAEKWNHESKELSQEGLRLNQNAQSLSLKQKKAETESWQFQQENWIAESLRFFPKPF